MKTSFLVATLLMSSAAYSQQDFTSKELQNAQTGAVVTEGHIALGFSCIKGTKEHTDLETPQITYRMYTVAPKIENSTRSKFVVEMIIVNSFSTISDIHSNLSRKVNATDLPYICGDSYVAKVAVGSRMTYTIDLDQSEAATLPTKTLTETDQSLASDFATEAVAVLDGIKSLSGFNFETSPYRPGMSFGWKKMITEMPGYRAAALADRTLQAVVQAEASPYPKAFTKEATTK